MDGPDVVQMGHKLSKTERSLTERLAQSPFEVLFVVREAHAVRHRYHVRQEIRGHTAYQLLLVVLVSLIASSAYGGSTEASDVYRTAASIRSLSLEQLALRYPAQVRGVVTQSTDDGLVIQDATAGVWVYWNRSDDFSVGDEVEVNGGVDPGLFAPSTQH